MTAAINTPAAGAPIGYRRRVSSGRHANLPTRGSQRGLALVAVLLLVLVSLAIGLLSANSSRTELKISHNDVLDKRALAVAEAGLNEARQQIAAHGVLNDELAVNSGGACTGNGVGNASSGLANIGSAATLASDGRCYRFSAFGGAATDGYYVRVEDNHDEATGTDNPLADVDNSIYVVSHGVVGTAERIVKALYTLNSAQAVYASDDIIISSSTIGSAAHPLRIGSGHTISQDSPPGSGSNPLSCSGPSRCAVYGSAVYGTTVQDPTKFSQGVTQAAAQTLTAVAACGPPWSANSGITPSAAYNASTGVVNESGGVVTIAPGTYCFSDVTVSGGSGRLEVDGPSPTIINLTGKLTFSGGAQVNNTTSSPDNLIVNSSNTTNNAVTVSGGSGTYMRINAPNPSALVTISGGSSAFNGSVKTYDFKITGGATLLDDADSSTVTLDNWREVQN